MNLRTEEYLYERAAAEVSRGEIRQGLWAKAFAENGGDNAKANAAYLKLRVQVMLEEFAEFENRAKAAQATAIRDAVAERKAIELRDKNLEALRRIQQREKDGMSGKSLAVFRGLIFGWIAGFAVAAGLIGLSGGDLLIEVPVIFGLFVAPIGGFVGYQIYRE